MTKADGTQGCGAVGWSVNDHDADAAFLREERQLSVPEGREGGQAESGADEMKRHSTGPGWGFRLTNRNAGMWEPPPLRRRLNRARRFEARSNRPTRGDDQ
jgi:hypothetical protein